MTIFVDKLFTAMPRTAQARAHGTRWCHMTTDGDLEELHRFAARIGLKRAWFQDHASLPHYDLTPAKRALAVRLGAVEVKARERTQQPQPQQEKLEQGRLL